jgi:hypothetical protein
VLSLTFEARATVHSAVTIDQQGGTVFGSDVDQPCRASRWRSCHFALAGFRSRRSSASIAVVVSITLLTSEVNTCWQRRKFCIQPRCGVDTGAEEAVLSLTGASDLRIWRNGVLRLCFELGEWRG